MGKKDFLGTGFHFPIQIDKATGRMMTTTQEEDIKEAIYLILMTKKGERLQNPLFGCDIYQFMYESLHTQTLHEIEKSVKMAIHMWEPRVKDILVHAELDKENEGLVRVSISYVVRTTNNPYNLVFPFYMVEGYGKEAER